LKVNKENIVTFNAKSVVYLFVTHEIVNKKSGLITKWKKWE